LLYIYRPYSLNLCHIYIYGTICGTIFGTKYALGSAPINFTAFGIGDWGIGSEQIKKLHPLVGGVLGHGE
jgi:hypothetical protein